MLKYSKITVWSTTYDDVSFLTLGSFFLLKPITFPNTVYKGEVGCEVSYSGVQNQLDFIKKMCIKEIAVFCELT